MSLNNILKQEFNLKDFQVENFIKLIDDGNTIPFIARYRKEMTGSLTDEVLRNLFDRLNYLRNLEEKKIQIKRLIEEQEKLTKSIEISIKNALTITELDDIYRPFKPKRRTRATIAKEKGLEPLANIIFEQNINKDLILIAKDFVNEEKDVCSPEDAIQGAKDIICENISCDPNIRSIIRNEILKNGIISSSSKIDVTSVYDMYYDYSEPIKNIVGHRILALNRGEKENFLNVKIEENLEKILSLLYKKLVKDNKNTKEYMIDIIEDSYKRLIFPSIEREIRNELTKKAEESSIKVFGENLKQLLLQPPIKTNNILSIDPGFRTGCKIAIIDSTGRPLHYDIIFPTTEKQDKINQSKEIIISYINKYDINIIAIGNGTASRETEQFIVDIIKNMKKEIFYIIVNEAGASVYSASKLATEEFPNLDVGFRSAISIGRRIQDPLAELVKIEPKSIGVGQYQHDMNQKRLSQMLEGVVEECVNNVGVDLNTASFSLLSYVSGISETIAKNIIKYREENGKFKNRKELLKVNKLGNKAFEQCAGFLKIKDGEVLLDSTSVHPESYDTTLKLIDKLNLSLQDIINSNGINIKNYDIDNLSKELEVGIPTLLDIIKELEKPNRDFRDDLPKPILKSDILTIENLCPEMILKGTVRNILDFGVFVDIGVHQDGLVHISEITEKFIKHPLDVVKIGDVINVRVLEIIPEKKRISLSMKNT